MQAEILEIYKRFEAKGHNKDVQINELQEKFQQVDCNMMELAKFKYEAISTNQQIQRE